MAGQYKWVYRLCLVGAATNVAAAWWAAALRAARSLKFLAAPLADVLSNCFCDRLGCLARVKSMDGQ